MDGRVDKALRYRNLGKMKTQLGRPYSKQQAKILYKF